MTDKTYRAYMTYTTYRTMSLLAIGDGLTGIDFQRAGRFYH